MERASEQGIENLFEKKMTENFPYLLSEKDTELQEAQRVPSKMNPKRSTQGHILIKIQKVKERERIFF